MEKRILGIDIRDGALSAVLIESNVSGNFIEANEYILPFDDEENDITFLDLLEDLAAKIDIESVECVASIPAESIYFRNVKMPFKEKKKIAQILPLELGPEMLVPVDEMVIDFRYIDADNNPEGVEIITAGVEETRIETFLEAFKSCGLDPDILTINGYATAIALGGMSGLPDHSLFIDADMTMATLFTIVSGQIYIVRPVFADLNSADGINSLCIEIDRVNSACCSRYNIDFKPETVFVTGTCLTIDSFEKRMSEKLEVPVKGMDLLRDTDINISNFPSMSWEPGQMDNALALTFASITGYDCFNFRKGKFAVERKWKEHKKDIIKTGIAALVMILVFLSYGIVDIVVTKKRVSSIETQIDNIYALTFPSEDIPADPVDEMQNRVDGLREIPMTSEAGNGRYKIDILNKVSKMIPESIDIEVKKIIISKDSVIISGSTDSFSTVDDIHARFEKEEMFTNVSDPDSSRDSRKNRVNFKLNMKL